MNRIILAAAVLSAAVISSCCGAEQTPAAGTSSNADALTVIMNRKSVRSYADSAVSDATIDTLLRAAMAAPSGRDVRPWHFVVLKDTSRYESVFGSDNFNLRMFKRSAAVVLFCADTTYLRTPRAGESGEAQVVPNNIWRDDMGACTENFLLAAEALGLGAVWTAVYPYPDRMNPILGALDLPVQIVPYCAVALGYPGGEETPKEKYDPRRIHSENW